MFQSKHVIRVSFICLFLSILSCILFYRYFTLLNIVLPEVSKNNNKIASTYTSRVWKKYLDSAPLSSNVNIEESVKNENFINFVSDSLNYLTESNVSKVEIYNSAQKVIISTNENNITKNKASGFLDNINKNLDSFFLSDYEFSDALNNCFKGVPYSRIITRAGYEHDTLNNGSKTFIESLIPIRNTNEGKYQVDIVIRFVVDITSYWERIKYFEQRVGLTLIAVFVIFFIVVLVNTHQAQKIIDQQQANNKLLEEAKIKAESESSAKTEFLANVSHELRTPLNAIIGFSEIIISEAYGKLDHPQYSEYVADINNSGKHLLSVINDILDFSKASADKLKVESIAVDVTKVASSSIRFVKPRADEANVKLIEKLPREHIVINADPKRLKQALLNLLSNSVKFTPENGSVTIELIKDVKEKLVYLKVVDTGIGMAEKDIPKALATFGQVDNKLSRKYEGTGLGLPLTKKLVSLMGGKFEISSKSGVGTTVTLIFPYDENYEG